MSLNDSNKWIVRQNNPQKRLRLFCFHYAGGSAVAFKEWQNLISSDIEICAIQLPGRGSRFGEEPYRIIGDLVPVLAKLIQEFDDFPCAFFGHSMGSLIAYETAKLCRDQNLFGPSHLLVSGGSAPGHRKPSSDYHKLSDAELIDVLECYNGAPAEALQHRELMALMLPMIRADFELVEKYQYVKSEKLAIPITTFNGESDSHVEEGRIFPWQEETQLPMTHHVFPGDHFYLQSAQEQLLEKINETLSDYLLS